MKELYTRDLKEEAIDELVDSPCNFVHDTIYFFCLRYDQEGVPYNEKRLDSKGSNLLKSEI